MRIAIAAPAPKQLEGGVANVVHNTADSLRRRGHEVTCIFRRGRVERAGPYSKDRGGPFRMEIGGTTAKTSKRV